MWVRREPGKGIVVLIALALQEIEKHLRHESSCENNAILQFRLTSSSACLNTDLHSAGLVGKREGYLGPVKVLGQGLVGKEGAWGRHYGPYRTGLAGNSETLKTCEGAKPRPKATANCVFVLLLLRLLTHEYVQNTGPTAMTTSDLGGDVTKNGGNAKICAMTSNCIKQAAMIAEAMC